MEEALEVQRVFECVDHVTDMVSVMTVEMFAVQHRRTGVARFEADSEVAEFEILQGQSGWSPAHVEARLTWRNRRIVPAWSLLR